MPSSGHHTLSGLLIATPAILAGLALTLAPGALRRILVSPEAQERGLAELPVRCPLGVCELRDELRPDPGRIVYAWRGIERWTISPKPLRSEERRVGKEWRSRWAPD